MSFDNTRPSDFSADLPNALRAAIKAGDLARVQALLPRWRAFTAPDMRSLLYDAVCHSRIPLISYLLSQEPGLAKSFSAAASCQFSSDVLQVFLDHGWDINEDDIKRGTALHRAVGQDNLSLVTWLLNRGADPNAAHNGSTPSSFRIMYGIAKGNTVLDTAARRCTPDTIDFLRQRGAQLERSNALHAAASGFRSGGDDQSRISMIEHLLNLGMDIDAIEFDNNDELRERFGAQRTLGTPLHYAVRGGMPHRVRLLLERGADREIMATHNTGTALDWAKRLDAEYEYSQEVVDLLSYQ
ncbi:MAG: hypothetical protein M1837_004566 [Sclerophora amabilis]|nr:MAG: hypothetical protein M1837_004566 [Sclerophora amabilis]